LKLQPKIEKENWKIEKGKDRPNWAGLALRKTS